MAQTKAEKAIQDFNNEVTVLALAKVDKDSLAKLIAADIKRKALADVRHVLDRQLNIGGLILKELKSEDTKVGRNFQGLIAEITNDMVDSIRNIKIDDSKK